VWKHQNESDPLSKAIYYAHLAKRSIQVNGGIQGSKRLLDAAAVNLRDSINTSTDEKPKKVNQVGYPVFTVFIEMLNLIVNSTYSTAFPTFSHLT
jgi:hypothetical protein